MLAKDIAAHEQDFRNHGVDSNGVKHNLSQLSAPIKGDNRNLTVTRCVVASGDSSFYYNESPLKDRVVLHFTAGYLKGDIANLTKKDYHVSVPFVVARDGAIYNLWGSGYWSYHLGPGAIGGNTEMSKRSVGIEISNIGPLTRKGNHLVTIYDSIYCDANETQYYQKSNYRGYEYYATFTEAQYKSVIDLLRYATGKFNIPRQFLPKDKRFELQQDIAKFHGITSHVNFRKDKYDIGPAFDWDRVIAGATK
ncbi:MAG: N-acetylmuramoyl-L-alanine amidase [Deferribacteres bacterium]|nr:N-acetylmuramoyl-L-alanine amidase [candidate division KSB1 bacterium]MCB9509296.1 N-acetylmuramoyl-L-alanine amidase [Deferribacteres bacterium]